MSGIKLVRLLGLLTKPSSVIFFRRAKKLVSAKAVIKIATILKLKISLYVSAYLNKRI